MAASIKEKDLITFSSKSFIKSKFVVEFEGVETLFDTHQQASEFVEQLILPTMKRQAQKRSEEELQKLQNTALALNIDSLSFSFIHLFSHETNKITGWLESFENVKSVPVDLEFVSDTKQLQLRGISLACLSESIHCLFIEFPLNTTVLPDVITSFLLNANVEKVFWDSNMDLKVLKRQFNLDLSKQTYIIDVQKRVTKQLGFHSCLSMERALGLIGLNGINAKPINHSE